MLRGPPRSSRSLLVKSVFPFSPSVALSQQLESVSGKTLFVVHALWDRVATTSVTTDTGIAGRGHGSVSVTHVHLLDYCALNVHHYPDTTRRHILYVGLGKVITPKRR